MRPGPQAAGPLDRDGDRKGGRGGELEAGLRERGGGGVGQRGGPHRLAAVVLEGERG